MSLKTELADRGVKLSELAKELGEAYGNLYTALQLEDQGAEVRHKAVTARLDKVRGWLSQTQAGEARAAASVEAVGDRDALLRRVLGWQKTPGWTVTTELELAGGKTLRCGDVLTVTGDEGSRLRYRFLRHVVNAAGAAWVDVYGPLPKKDNDWAGQHRSLRPSALGLEVVTPC